MLDHLVKTMGDFIRPIVIESEVSEFRFYGSGTAFLCQYLGKAFVICARHTWVNMGITIDNFRLFIPRYDWALPFDYEAILGEEERSDLKVLRVDSQILAGNPPDSINAFNLDRYCYQEDNFPEHALMLGVGYPQCRRGFDYEAKVFKANITAFSGPLVGELTTAVLTMKTDLTYLEDINGVSGSPVFCLSDGIPQFAGIVIRAGRESGLVHFIHVGRVLQILEELVDLPFRSPEE